MKYAVWIWMVTMLKLFALEPALTLREVYELALAHEPAFRVASYKTEAVGETIRQAKSKFFPQAQLSVSGGKYAYEAYYNHIGMSEIYKTYALSLTQPLYHPEYLRVFEQTQTRFDAATEDLKKQSQQLGLNVVRSYIKILQADGNVSRNTAQLKFLQAKYARAKEMFVLGLVNRIDLLDAKVARDKANADCAVAKRQLEAAKVQLSHMIARPFESVPQRKVSSGIDALINNKEYWTALLSDNPDIKIAEFSNKMAKDEVDIRAYDHYPKIDLSLGRSENYTGDPVAHKYDNKALVQLSLPLYQGGYTTSRVQEAMLSLHATVAGIADARKSALDRLEDLWVEKLSLHDSVQVFREAEQSLALYVKAVQQGEQEGIRSNVDVLEAQAKYEAVRIDLDGALYSLLVNQLALLDLTGHLSLETLNELEKAFFH